MWPGVGTRKLERLVEIEWIEVKMEGLTDFEAMDLNACAAGHIRPHQNPL